MNYKWSELQKMESPFDEKIKMYESFIEKHQEATETYLNSGNPYQTPIHKKNKYLTEIMMDIQKRISIAVKLDDMEKVVFLQSQLYHMNKQKVKILKQMKVDALRYELRNKMSK